MPNRVNLNKKAAGEGAPNAPVMNTLEELHIKLGELSERSRDIQNTADAEKRDLTAEDLATLEEVGAQFNKIEKDIKARMATEDMDARVRAMGGAMSQPQARAAKPEGLDVNTDNDGDGGARPYASGPQVGMPVGTSKSSLGFRSIGQWAVAARATKLGRPDMRIVNAPTSFGQEGVSQDGGFAVPPDFRQNIMKTIMSEESLLSRCDQQVTSSNSISLPLDTTTPWQTSGGVQPAWLGEGGTLSQSKPQLQLMETKLHKLGALVPVTEELLQDVPSLTAWLQSKVPEKFTSFINDAIVNGNGVGKPLGMLNANAKITAGAISGQGAGTVVAHNIADMWSRVYGPLRQKALWLINQDVEPQLQLMTMPGTSPAYPVYLPPGGFSASPYGTLYGRPVLPLEACQTVGTEGDIILCVPDEYLVAMKSDGMRSDVSIHLYFDADVTAFRFVMRLGGQSYWPAAAVRAHGSNTLSVIVTLNSTRT